LFDVENQGEKGTDSIESAERLSRMWLRNSRNQFIRSGFEHAGQNKEGEKYEEKRYLCANESWIDGMGVDGWS
jgi:hypothetical protein